MRSLVLVASIVLAFMDAETCISQEAAQRTNRDAEAVVVKLYEQILFRKPDGLVSKEADRKAIWPLLSRKLIKQIAVAQECENDYFRQYPSPDLEKDPNALILKPPFGWLEFGLFSGGNEKSGPSRFSVRRTVRQKDGSYQVRVKLTWWDDERNRRPPEPAYRWNWEVGVFLIPEEGHLVVDDVLYSKDDPDEGEFRLSQLLRSGCRDGKWDGYPDKL